MIATVTTTDTNLMLGETMATWVLMYWPLHP